MSFEPFGYRFEVRSPRPPAAVKSDIRSRKKRWLEVKNGARGWIAGPFLCLWFSAFDTSGPMLLGVISSDGAGTRVHGRAGSDLNGVAMFSLLIPLMMFLTWELIVKGSAYLPLLTGAAVAFLLGGPLVYWLAHKDRHKAEPLVRFLRDVVVASGRTPHRKYGAVTIRQGLTLSIGGERLTAAVDQDAIHAALMAAGSDDFAILESGPETYLQTASRDGGYVVEKREGNGREHFRALRRKGNSVVAKLPDDIFDFDEVHEIFMAYASAAPAPPFFIWERLLLAK